MPQTEPIHDEASEGRSAPRAGAGADREGEGFPFAGAVCEGCGYALQGLNIEGQCPECGLAIAESSPVHRPGLPWQNRRSPNAFFKTSMLVATQPKQAFRMMRMGGGNSADRLFMLTFALGAGLIWAGVWRLADLPLSWAWGSGISLGIVTMTYIEVLGIMRVSYWRGQTQAWAAAERVCCYAGVGWIAALLIGLKLCLLETTGSIRAWWPTGVMPYNDWAAFFFYIVTAAAGMFWYETLVWIGVDHSRFGNPPGPTKTAAQTAPSASQSGKSD